MRRFFRPRRSTFSPALMGWLYTLILSLVSCPLLALADGQPVRWGVNLQQAHTPVMGQIHLFHNYIIHVQWIVCAVVGALLVYIIWRFRKKKNPTPSTVTHNTKLEVAWTLIPLAVILYTMYPSLKLLYFVDVEPPADMTLKVVGHQWYWSYEYPDNQNISFESRMIEEKDLQPGQLRLLSTDNAVVLPVDTTIRIIGTSEDVIHSWAVPSFGVKKDTIPGRLNETWLRIDKPGKYYGQCSELCGIGHGFMPIDITAVSKEAFKAWVASKAPVPDPAAAPATVSAPASQMLATSASSLGAAPQKIPS